MWPSGTSSVGSAGCAEVVVGTGAFEVVVTLVVEGFGFGAFDVVVGVAEVVSSVGSAGLAEVVEGAGFAEVFVALVLVGFGFGAFEVVDSTTGALEVVVGAVVCSVVVATGVLVTSVLTGMESALSHATSSGVPTASAVIRERVDFFSPKMRPFAVERPAPLSGVGTEAFINIPL